MINELQELSSSHDVAANAVADVLVDQSRTRFGSRTTVHPLVFNALGSHTLAMLICSQCAQDIKSPLTSRKCDRRSDLNANMVSGANLGVPVTS